MKRSGEVLAIYEEEQRRRREEIRKRNEPPKLTVGEEVGNAVTHGVGACLAIAGFILLLMESGGSWRRMMASCFYGISLIFLMLMSCLYHSFRSGSKVKRIWRRFDYNSIYLLIGGTFAPLYLVYLENTMGIVLFCIQWTLILFGIVMISVFGPGRLRVLHFSMYFVIGWSGLMFIPDFIKHNMPLLVAIIVGGVVYTFGMIPFVKEKKGSHFIWHFFVLAGAVIHWFGIYFFVY